eukprot:8491480-Karenia_brevis.AAC.1
MMWDVIGQFTVTQVEIISPHWQTSRTYGGSRQGRTFHGKGNDSFITLSNQRQMEEKLCVYVLIKMAVANPNPHDYVCKADGNCSVDELQL